MCQDTEIHLKSIPEINLRINFTGKTGTITLRAANINDVPNIIVKLINCFNDIQPNGEPKKAEMKIDSCTEGLGALFG